jgi:hypothetical protein
MDEWLRRTHEIIPTAGGGGAHRNNRIKTCPSVTPSTTNPTWTGLVSKLVLCCGGATRDLKYGRVLASCRVQYHCWRTVSSDYLLNGGYIRSTLTAANQIPGTSGLVNTTNINPILIHQHYCQQEHLVSSTRPTSTLFLYISTTVSRNIWSRQHDQHQPYSYTSALLSVPIILFILFNQN